LHCELNFTPRVIIGADARTQLAEQAKNLCFSHILLVSDPFHEKAGRTSEIAQLLSRAGMEVSVYTGVTNEPDTDMVERGLKQFQAGKCNGIVALGGGSVIDTAKTISVPRRRSHCAADHFRHRFGGNQGGRNCRFKHQTQDVRPKLDIFTLRQHPRLQADNEHAEALDRRYGYRCTHSCD